jgi:hypothetical protein
MLKRVPTISNRLRVVNFTFTHMSHSDHVPHLSILLEVRDSDCCQVDRQNLLDNVDIQHVHLQLRLDLALLDRLLFFAGFILEQSSKREFARVQLLDGLLNVFNVPNNFCFPGIEALHIRDTGDECI